MTWAVFILQIDAEVLIDGKMWPNRLPYIGNIVQPQGLLPMQIPVQNPYLQPQPLITNPLIHNPYAQPKVVYAQPMQYRPVVNPVYLPPNIQYLPYHRPEVSHVTYIATKPLAAADDSRNSAAASVSDRDHSVASVDDVVSLSSRSSNVGSPFTDVDELPLVLDNACQMNDFTDQSARFYDAFYEVCCQNDVDLPAAAANPMLDEHNVALNISQHSAMDCEDMGKTGMSCSTSAKLDGNDEENCVALDEVAMPASGSPNRLCDNDMDVGPTTGASTLEPENVWLASADAATVASSSTPNELAVGSSSDEQSSGAGDLNSQRFRKDLPVCQLPL